MSNCAKIESVVDAIVGSVQYESETRAKSFFASIEAARTKGDTAAAHQAVEEFFRILSECVTGEKKCLLKTVERYVTTGTWWDDEVD